MLWLLCLVVFPNPNCAGQYALSSKLTISDPTGSIVDLGLVASASSQVLFELYLGYVDELLRVQSLFEYTSFACLGLRLAINVGVDGCS